MVEKLTSKQDAPRGKATAASNLVLREFAWMRGRYTSAGVFTHILRNGGRIVRDEDLTRLVGDGSWHGDFEESPETAMFKKNRSYVLMGLFDHGNILRREGPDGFGTKYKGVRLFGGSWNLPWDKEDVAVFRPPLKRAK